MTEDIQAHKVIVLGDAGVGKTSIISNYIYNEIDEKHTPTLSPSFNRKSLKIDDKEVVMNIWDTMGKDRFISLNKLFFKGSEAAILVYDITNKDSYEKLKKVWYKHIEEECGKNKISKFTINLN